MSEFVLDVDIVHLVAMQRELVELYGMCHTKMEEIIPRGETVRYNL